MNRSKTIGKEQYAFLMSKYKQPSNLNYKHKHWACSFRDLHREEFNVSYLLFLKINKIMLFGKELESNEEEGTGSFII